MHANLPGPFGHVHHHPDPMDALYYEEFVPERFKHPLVELKTQQESNRLTMLDESLAKLTSAVVDCQVKLPTLERKLVARATLAESSNYMESLLTLVLGRVKKVDGITCDNVTQYLENRVAGLYLGIMTNTEKRSKPRELFERTRVSKLRKPVGNASFIIASSGAALIASKSAEASFVGGGFATAYLATRQMLNNTVRTSVRNAVDIRYNQFVKPVTNETKRIVHERQRFMGLELTNHQLVKLTRYVEVEIQLEDMHDKIWGKAGRQAATQLNLEQTEPDHMAHTIRVITEQSIRDVLGLDFVEV